MNGNRRRLPPEWETILDGLRVLLQDRTHPTITVTEGDFTASITLPAAHPARAAATPPEGPKVPPFSEMESAVIEALGADTMTGQEIADRAGYPYDGSLRQCLAAMRRSGVLGGDPRSAGYFVTNP